MPTTLAPLFACLSHGVYVIGVRDGDAYGAFTAAWLTQVSFDPPLLALSINPHHRSFRLLDEGGAFAVNVLALEQTGLAAHFGRSAPDKLTGVAWAPGARTGAPILRDALAWLECQVETTCPAGDHVLVLGRVINGARVSAEATPLLYRDVAGLDGAAALFPATFPRA